jgi:hypothetical protein
MAGFVVRRRPFPATCGIAAQHLSYPQKLVPRQNVSEELDPSGRLNFRQLRLLLAGDVGPSLGDGNRIALLRGIPQTLPSSWLCPKRVRRTENRTVGRTRRPASPRVACRIISHRPWGALGKAGAGQGKLQCEIETEATAHIVWARAGLDSRPAEWSGSMRVQAPQSAEYRMSHGVDETGSIRPDPPDDVLDSGLHRRVRVRRFPRVRADQRHREEGKINAELALLPDLVGRDTFGPEHIRPFAPA